MHMTRHDAEEITTSNDENKLLHFQVDELKEYKAQATEYSEKLSKEEKKYAKLFSKYETLKSAYREFADHLSSSDSDSD